MDIEKIVSWGDPVQLLNLLNLYKERSMWTDVQHRARKSGLAAEMLTADSGLQLAEAMLAELPVVSGLNALRATTRLVERLQGGRWMAMMEAREQGEGWDEIAAAVGLDGEDRGRVIRNWYTGKIELQEQYVPSHDSARARAVLDDPALGS
jgi:hypothetical protein